MDNEADQPLILKVTEDFRKSQYHFQELVVSLILLREFPQGASTPPIKGTAHVASNH
jgi:hypothetical protein